VRAVAVAAFLLGMGLAGEPFEPLPLLLAVAVVAILAFALERPGKPLQIFCVGFFGVLATVALAHARFGPSSRPGAVVDQLYLNLYPGSGVVGIGLGLLGASSAGRKHAPRTIAAIGAVVGVALFFLL
jgi:hypothetical protein